MSIVLTIALFSVSQVRGADSNAPSNPPIDIVAAIESAMADAIAKAEPSVVAISREKSANGRTLAIRGVRPSAPDVQTGLGGRVEPKLWDFLTFDYGSGVVIGANGEILTAYHVVKGGERIIVRATDRQQFEAEILAADSRIDLAVIAPIEIPNGPRITLKPIAIGDASKLRKGSFLIALGNPFNAALDGNASAAWGILSNTARRLIDVSEERLLRHFPTLLQLDSKLNLGLSGGAVVNLKGELVGLTTGAVNAGGFDAQAGYAVPIDRLGRRAIDALRQGKEVEYGFLGLRFYPEERSNRVDFVQPGAPAFLAGLIKNDRILSVGEIPVFDFDTLVSAVNTFAPGIPVPLVIERDGKRVEKTVLLGKFPNTGEIIVTNRPPPWRGLRVDYLSILANIALGPDVDEEISRGGVAIAEVVVGSAAAAAGLRSGEVICKVDGVRVRTPEEFAKATLDRKDAVNVSLAGGRIAAIQVAAPTQGDAPAAPNP